jgi:hypothetical protein
VPRCAPSGRMARACPDRLIGGLESMEDAGRISRSGMWPLGPWRVCKPRCSERGALHGVSCSPRPACPADLHPGRVGRGGGLGPKAGRRGVRLGCRYEQNTGLELTRR